MVEEHGGPVRCEITEPYDSGQALNDEIAHFHAFTWLAALNHQKRGFEPSTGHFTWIKLIHTVWMDLV
jgi:hypothetical protein